MAVKKIDIESILKPKYIEKIFEVTEKGIDVDESYDKIKKILKDTDFKEFDVGTNRVIYVNKKYKDFVFKIAGDSHGISANYREFYNGDLDKRLTSSISISDNGVILVQERVDRMDSSKMKKYKKDIIKMLRKLSGKILLVDCKLSNFKNFGIRKNGECCLLDHGDTVPFRSFQSSMINEDEEDNVSLRCKRVKKGTINKKDMKQCNGHLEYNDDFSLLICDKCGSSHYVHEAYQAFYGDLKKKNKDDTLDKIREELKEEIRDEDLSLISSNNIRDYCINTMKKVKNNKEEGSVDEMGKKSEKFYEVGGYRLPIGDQYIGSSLMLARVLRGSMSPKEYLKAFDLKPKNFKIEQDDVAEETKSNEDTVVQSLYVVEPNNKVYDPDDAETIASTYSDDENDQQYDDSDDDDEDDYTMDEYEDGWYSKEISNINEEDDEDLGIDDQNIVNEEMQDTEPTKEDAIDIAARFIIESINNSDNGYTYIAPFDWINRSLSLSIDDLVTELRKNGLNVTIDYEKEQLEVTKNTKTANTVDEYSDIISSFAGDEDINEIFGKYYDVCDNDLSFLDILFFHRSNIGKMFNSIGWEYELGCKVYDLIRQSSDSEIEVLSSMFKILQVKPISDIREAQLSGTLTTRYARQKFVPAITETLSLFKGYISDGVLTILDFIDEADRLNVEFNDDELISLFPDYLKVSEESSDPEQGVVVEAIMDETEVDPAVGTQLAVFDINDMATKEIVVYIDDETLVTLDLYKLLRQNIDKIVKNEENKIVSIELAVD